AALARQTPAPALPAALWARRSVFLLRGRALMVSEAFLPAILELRK
ncbi:MAG TPA: chorismate--pyruvate lyase, partial [Thauera phenylacetica]|nr:chorismate--pyruvate lyase [Thauera phenylacetica]